MEELKQKKETNIEISIKKQKEIQYELIDKLIPYENHTIWQINNETFEIKKAKYSNTTYKYGEKPKKEIIIIKGWTYISALNKKNALKKFKKGNNGGKNIDNEPMKLLNL